MSMPEETTFQRKIRERREALARQQPEVEKEQFDPDLVPDVAPLRPVDEQLEAIIDKVDIAGAYKKWCNKSPVPSRRGTEGLKVSCPNPAHPDKHPSAWLNTDKQLWYCGACSLGGDKFDIAAYKYGYKVPEYRKGKTFREVKEKMAADLGYIKTSSAGSTWYEEAPSTGVENPVDEKSDNVGGTGQPEQTPSNGGEQIQDQLEPSGLATVSVIYDDDDEDDRLYLFPRLEWPEIVRDETFLAKWMALTTTDDVAEEYHFWNGLMAIALAIGRDITLYDQVPVYGNLFTCTVGHSGDGKSQSARHLKSLVDQALPYKHSDPNSKGIRVVGSPASAEALIHNFSKPVLDPTDFKRIAYYASVRGLVDFNELSGLVGRTSRLGNVLQPTLMDFYDMSRVVSTTSMTHGEKVAHEPYACMTTTTQPRAFRDLVQKSDITSGFLNRILFVGGVEKKRKAIGGVMVDTAPLVPDLRAIHAWSGKTRTLSWSREAADDFEEFYHELVFPTKRKDKTGLLVRIDLTLKKLALLLTVNNQEEEVTEATVKSLVPLYNYLVACYGLSSDAISNNLHAEMREFILRIISRVGASNSHRGGATQREIGQRMSKQKYPMKQIAEVLRLMQELGEIEKCETPAGKVGRPTVYFKVAE